MNLILQIFVLAIVSIYIVSLIFIFLYSLTQANLVIKYLLFRKRYRIAQQPVKKFESLPFVTVQLPIYNERYVVERLIDCIIQLDYPADKIEIQILDDSTDETSNIIAEKLLQLNNTINIKHIRRADRTDYKAGALKEGLAVSSGELIAIFDADFLPNTDFLLATVPHFINAKVGMVQTKWDWLNKTNSIITSVQAFALDAHFSIEQVGRNIQNGFINFNGTAGIWRKSCIIDAGNWKADTLTEDLDLSYRAQLKDWRFIYLEDVNAPSELPPIMSAVKTQQYRWNKGGAETARKHLYNVIVSKKSLVIKWHAIMHLLTSGLFLSVFTCAFLSVPMLWINQVYTSFHNIFLMANYLMFGFVIIASMYLVTVSIQQKNILKGLVVFLQTMPPFIILSMGLSLHNSIAVLEGYLGRKTPFVRTPKFNIIDAQSKWLANNYIKKEINPIIYAEAGLMIYFISAIFLAFYVNDFKFILFHLMLALGYGAVVYFSLFDKKSD